MRAALNLLSQLAHSSEKANKIAKTAIGVTGLIFGATLVSSCGRDGFAEQSEVKVDLDKDAKDALNEKIKEDGVVEIAKKYAERYYADVKKLETELEEVVQKLDNLEKAKKYDREYARLTREGDDLKREIFESKKLANAFDSIANGEMPDNVDKFLVIKLIEEAQRGKVCFAD